MKYAYLPLLSPMLIYLWPNEFNGANNYIALTVIHLTETNNRQKQANS